MPRKFPSFLPHNLPTQPLSFPWSLNFPSATDLFNNANVLACALAFPSSWRGFREAAQVVFARLAEQRQSKNVWHRVASNSRHVLMYHAGATVWRYITLSQYLERRSIAVPIVSRRRCHCYLFDLADPLQHVRARGALRRGLQSTPRRWNSQQMFLGIETDALQHKHVATFEKLKRPQHSQTHRRAARNES
jgi:hypothetical protein